MKKLRTIEFHKDYFQDFYSSVSNNVREKISYVFKLIESMPIVSQRFLKHIEGKDNLYEIRIEVRSNIYRIFCCFDNGNLVVLFNAFQKKTQKTPSNEIKLAEKLKKEYFKNKEGKNEKK